MRIEEQTGFGRFERNLFQLVNELAALLVDFSAFEKLLFVGSGCFGQQKMNVVFNRLDLLRDLLDIVPRAFCSLIQRACFLVESQKTLQLHDPGIDVCLSHFILARKLSNIRFDLARFVFGLPKVDVARVETLGTFGHLRME